ncbi:MAG: C40 family peptidase [Actinobacteria bacterium]|nr:C40 family peptidase [Actinomycetota bacterium]
MIRKTLTGILSAAIVMIFAVSPLASAEREIKGNFPDIGGMPAEIQSAIIYSTDMGYLYGAADGNFYPAEPAARLDAARAMVKIFGHDNEEADPGIAFTDMGPSDPLYKYANLATKYNYVPPYPDGSYKPMEAISTAAIMAGFARGMGFEEQVKFAEAVYPRGPDHRGTTIIGHDLHLKYRKTTTWPSHAYSRGELAFSLQMADTVDEWRKQYIRDNFDWLHCQAPWLGPVRQGALDNAFAKIGYPYVWGGDCDAENGYDCSGLVYYVLNRALGYPMQRVADDQARDGRYPAVNRLELLAGDPVFFYEENTGNPASYIGHAGIYIGQDLFIHSTGSNAGVSVDSLDGYWGDYFAWGKRVINEPEPETFDTYILLSNPQEAPAAARLTYMLPDGTELSDYMPLDPFSRRTVKVDKTLVNQEFSTVVEAIDGSVIAERSMYFRYKGVYPGGHVSAGVTGTASMWYMAEGCTAYGFDTYILIQNPGSRAVDAVVSFMKPNGDVVDLDCVIGPDSRYTICADNVPGLSEAEFSTEVSASGPVVAERSMYFEYNGIREGHNSPGIFGLSSNWFFAEGYTTGSFDSYILLANPGEGPADVVMTLMSGNGEESQTDFTIGPNSRYTVMLDKIPGWEAAEVSVEVTSDVPVAAERSMYFNYNGITGGHNALGSPSPGKVWYLAEGYTAQDFDTYILLSNPGDEKTEVAVRYMVNGGGFLDHQYSVPAHSRYTISVDKIEGLSAAEVSARIIGDNPIIVERSIYFKYGARSGGSCAPGVTGTSGRWYFAEGYTGL